MERRPNPPGQHGRGTGRPSAESDYKRQLTEKQRLKAQYNIHERQMRNYFRQAQGRAGNTIDTLSQLLERRLDAIVHRGGLAPTIYAARQYVTHGHVLVNGKRVSVPGYRVAVGDVVQIKEGSRHLAGLQEALDSASPPPYLTLNAEEASVRVDHLPLRAEIPVICEFDQVIEFYSR
jgi:small subunit ribosomal protein S4